MRQAVIAVFSAFALLVTGACGETEGTTYEAPVEKVYEKLSNLDMGADIGSAVFMYHEKSLPTATETNKSVSWHMGGKQGSDVVARLTPVNATQTRVVVDINIPEGNVAAMPAPLVGLTKNLIRERIAAHLEDRPFDDKKYMDVFYGGGGLVPQHIRDAGMNAQREYARTQRELDEHRMSAEMAPAEPERVEWGKPVQTESH